MNLVDTHCHVHEADYPLSSDEVIKVADKAGVTKIICIGTDMTSSSQAVGFAARYDKVWAIIGVHPHESKHGIEGLTELINEKKIVGIGEIGLDYYYNHSPRDIQIKTLNQQIEIALKNNLPISFHVREAFDDFWPIVDNFGSKIRAVVHSFTDTIKNLDRSLEHNFMIGVNGIVTFNKDPSQNDMYRRIPLSNMILETDSPFLTPKPYRGNINQPAFVKEIAYAVAELKRVEFDEVSRVTTANAQALFNI